MNIIDPNSVSSAPNIVNQVYRRIRHIYVDKGLSHAKLAKLLQKKHGITCSDVFVYQLLIGKRSAKKPFGKRVLAALCVELGLDPSEFDNTGGSHGDVPTVPMARK